MTMVFALLSIPAEGDSQTTPYIDMNTTVEREVTPDEIYLRITISENDYKGKKSLEEMQSALIGALKANKIDVAENLSLNYMGSDISYKLFSRSIKPKSEATYTLKLHDTAIMQQIIASLEEHQISNIELARTRYTKENELKATMAVEAMKQAQAEAQVLAEAIGQEVGKALSINSWFNNSQEIQPRLYKARANTAEDTAAGNADTPQIGISKQTYRFNVNVRFELK